MRKLAQWTIGIVISAGALVLVFRGADLATILTTFRSANYVYLWPALGLTLAALLTRALSWKAILGPAIPYRRVFWAINEGYLLNNCLPLRLGELGRAYLISRTGTVSVEQALSSVVVERVIDLSVIVGMLAAFLPLVAGLAWARNSALLALGVSGGALLGLTVVTRYRVWAMRWAAWGLRRATRFNTAPLEARLSAFLEGLAVLQDGRRSLGAAFWSAVAWSTAGLSAWALLLAFLPSATLPMGFFTFIVAGLSMAAPSAPGNVGVFEAAVVFALQVFKVDSNLALSYAVALHAINLGLTSLCGGLALAQEGETIAHLAQAARSLGKNRPPSTQWSAE